MALTLDLLTAALARLPGPPPDALQAFSAEAFANQHYPQLDPAQPALILGCQPALLPRLKSLLSLVYPADHRLVLLAPDGVLEQPLSALDTAAQSSGLFVPPLPAPGAYAALQDVVARLRAPDGCPWDRALTWAKLRASLLEESYELLAALDTGDAAKVLEEQGDLLLQVALQVQIAAEVGVFRLPDVIARIVEKLIRRHPHVFDGAQVSDTDEVLANWEAIKAAERARNGEKRSPLAGVPAGLPALAQAEAYLDRMSRLRPNVTPAAPGELLARLPAGAPLSAEQVGGLLFELVAWALAHGIEAETALRQTNARYAAQIAAEGWG